MAQPLGIVARCDEQRGRDFWTNAGPREERRRARLDEAPEVAIEQANFIVELPPPVRQAAKHVVRHLFEH